MIHTSKEAFRTVFYVPNNDDGRAFLKQVRKYLNRANWKVRVRGRNENRKQYRAVTGRKLKEDLPQKYASYFAVYVHSAALDQEIKELKDLREEIARYQRELYNRKEEHNAILAEQAAAQAAELQKSVDKVMLRFSKRHIRV